MKKITDIPDIEFKGKVVVMRVDYNVPVKDGKVLDTMRVDSSLKSIAYVIARGASVILLSHIENKEGARLKPVAQYLGELHQNKTVDFSVLFYEDTASALTLPKETFSQPGSVHLFENIRDIPGEKANDPALSSLIAKLGDIYINEAFSVCHRPHATVVGVPALLPHAAGFNLMDEVQHIQKGLNPTHPFVFILGGAKFETKLPLIEKFLQKADKVVIGGALFNDVLKAKGYSVGSSLVGDGHIDISHVINHPSLICPSKVVVKNIKTYQVSEVDVRDISPEDTIVDISTTLVTEIKDYIDEMQTQNLPIFVLWNGPMGLYEQGYTQCTEGIARLLIQKHVDGLVGGGDTTAAIATCLQDASNNSIQATDPQLYISTGGGAMIEYLMNDTLPGIEALK